MNVWKFSSSAFAASVASPCFAPRCANQPNAPSRHSVRRKMSRLSTISRLSATRSASARTAIGASRAAAAATASMRRARNRMRPQWPSRRRYRQYPAEAIHVEQHGADVHRIDEHLRDEREPHALHAEQVAEHDVVRERERGAPDSRVAVGERRGADGVAAAERGQRKRQQRHLQRQYRGAERERDDQRAQQVQADPGGVARAMRLRDEARRPHPQETEAPEHEIEEQPAERDAAQVLRAVEVARDGRVDGTEDRLGQVREDDRERERETRRCVTAAVPAPCGNAASDMADASGAFLHADPRRDDDRPQLRVARRVIGSGFGRHAYDEARRQPARDLLGIVVGNGFRDADEIEVACHGQLCPARRSARDRTSRSWRFRRGVWYRAGWATRPRRSGDQRTSFSGKTAWWRHYKPSGRAGGTGRPAYASRSAAHDLAGRGHRQAVDERDRARILVRGEARAHMCLQRLHERLVAGVAGIQHHERLDDLGARRVGHADDGRHPHRRMREQAVLDRAGPIR